MALAGGGRLKRALGELYLKARGHGDGALAILGFAGSTEHIDSQRAKTLQVARKHGALSLGERPGQAWAKQRFAAPYLRDELLTHGVMAETFETATNWSNLTHLHHRLAAASANALGHPQTPVMILCHVSHVYETGASLYFTVITRQREGEEIEQWLALKRAAGDAIKDSGATITHHHAIGRDHTEWMRSEVGRSGLDVLSALKACLDPAGIMNPGKLLP
jgi:alkyldihydroxyacetonephosphate synthase